MGSIEKGLTYKEDTAGWDGATATDTRESSDGYTITLNKLDWIGVDALKEYGGGVNRTNATITSALTAIGTTNKVTVWLSPGTWTFSANVDWSTYTNVTFAIPPGALISHGAYTIQFGGPVSIGNYQAFNGTGAVTFINGTRVLSAWFSGFNAGLTCLGSTQKVIYRLSQDETMTAAATVESNITWEANPDCLISAAAAYTLTIKGLIEIPRKQWISTNITLALHSTALQRFDYPEWWGIDGTADEVQINLALTCAATGDDGYGSAPYVSLDAKRYDIAAPILMKNNHVDLIGASRRNTIIHRTMATGNSLTIEPDTPASNLAQHIKVANITFYQTTNVPTAGAHIYWNSVTGVEIENCYLIDGYYGIYMKGGSDCLLDKVKIRGTDLTDGTTLATGLVLTKNTDNADVANPAAIGIRNLRIDHQVGYSSYDIGVHIACADGVWFYESHIGTSDGSGDVYISPGAGYHLAGVYFIGCYFDDQGVNIDTTSTTTYGPIQFKGCFFDGDGTDSDEALIINADCDAHDILIEGCQFFNWGDRAIYHKATAAKGVSILNNQIWDNDKSAGSTYAITVADSVAEFSIQNNLIGNSEGGANYGSIKCGTSGGAGVSQCIVSGNNCQNNTDDEIYVYGIAGVQVKDNIDGTAGSAIASAGTITLPANGEYFSITGTTAITSITASWIGRIVTLNFAGIINAVTDGSNLKLAGSFTTSADDTITLVCNGTNWYEISRSVN